MSGCELIPLLGLIAAAGGVGLHLEEVGELPMENALAVIEALSSAIERRTGVKPVVDDPSWSTCDSVDRCLGEIMSRTRADIVIFARVFGGPSLIHVVLDREPRSETGRASSAELDLGRKPEDLARWAELLDGAAASLFPDAKRVDLGLSGGEAPPATAVTAPEPTFGPAPWIALGAGVVAGTLAAVFGLSSRSAKNALESSVHLQLERDDLDGRMRVHGLAANVLFGTAAVALITGVALIALE